MPKHSVLGIAHFNYSSYLCSRKIESTMATTRATIPTEMKVLMNRVKAYPTCYNPQGSRTWTSISGAANAWRPYGSSSPVLWISSHLKKTLSSVPCWATTSACNANAIASVRVRESAILSTSARVTGKLQDATPTDNHRYKIHKVFV